MPWHPCPAQASAPKADTAEMLKATKPCLSLRVSVVPSSQPPAPGCSPPTFPPPFYGVGWGVDALIHQCRVETGTRPCAEDLTQESDFAQDSTHREVRPVLPWRSPLRSLQGKENHRDTSPSIKRCSEEQIKEAVGLWWKPLLIV